MRAKHLSCEMTCPADFRASVKRLAVQNYDVTDTQLQKKYRSITGKLLEFDSQYLSFLGATRFQYSFRPCNDRNGTYK
jgi:hypothetical protein